MKFSTDDWTPTEEKMPPEGLLVLTKTEDRNGCRNKQKLLRDGRLWFVEDRSMYVYYTPTHWKCI